MIYWLTLLYLEFQIICAAIFEEYELVLFCVAVEELNK